MLCKAERRIADVEPDKLPRLERNRLSLLRFNHKQPRPIRDFPDVEIPFFLSEEHVVVRNVPDWGIGDVLQLIPSHACTTCNLYRELVVHADGRVVDVWPIEASGKLS